MPEGWQPRGVTPHPRSRAVAQSARLRRHRNAREELPCVRGQRRQRRGATPRPRPGTMAERSYPKPEARGGGREEQPHVQGVVAAQAQEGLEELSHFKRQEGWR